jgi:hypothetical protein
VRSCDAQWGSQSWLPPAFSRRPDTPRTSAALAQARSNFGKLLRLGTPEPDVLKPIGEESQRKGTHKMTTREIDQIIKTSRMQKTKCG